VVSSARQRIATALYFAEIKDDVFDGADLTGVSPEHVRFRRCSFRGADLQGATLDGCDFFLCDLREANLKGASLRSVRFTGCYLGAADLRDCDLTEAELTYSAGDDERPTDVTGALLDGADLTDLTVERVIGWPAQ
jgi:uncharacterized protein YjbI with pentapeptide repeats